MRTKLALSRHFRQYHLGIEAHPLSLPTDLALIYITNKKSEEIDD
jgi:hypothetical protein